MDDTLTQRYLESFKIHLIDGGSTTPEEFLANIRYSNKRNAIWQWRELKRPTYTDIPERKEIYNINIKDEIMSPLFRPTSYARVSDQWVGMLQHLTRDVERNFVTHTGTIHPMRQPGVEYFDKTDVIHFAQIFRALATFDVDGDRISPLDAFENVKMLFRHDFDGPDIAAGTMLGYDMVLSGRFANLQSVNTDISRWAWMPVLIELVKNVGVNRETYFLKHLSIFKCMFFGMIAIDAEKIELRRRAESTETTIIVSDGEHLRVNTRVHSATYDTSRYSFAAKFIQIICDLLSPQERGQNIDRTSAPRGIARHVKRSEVISEFYHHPIRGSLSKYQQFSHELHDLNLRTYDIDELREMYNDSQIILGSIYLLSEGQQKIHEPTTSLLRMAMDRIYQDLSGRAID